MKREETECPESSVAEAVSRGDFLRTIGMGLGAAGLAGLMGGQAFAGDPEGKGKYVIVITNGGNDPNRAVFALLMAQVVADKGWGKLHVWMTWKGPIWPTATRPGGSNPPSSRSSAMPKAS
ncbi:hypothetical protein [Geobacter sulfurreducens]|uniref:hypothetical protein n=1 Tax=Geobacter sulfurreducens TaxID=35554 RepID=UPI000022E9F5|nr:hypothetical protein [Geobacter sulfurreducens]